MKLTVVEGFRLTEIAAWAQQHLSPGTQVLSDGLSCFNGVTAAGCVHEPMVTGGGKAAVERPVFRWVNTIFGNIKSALRGTYHAIRPKYAQRYLAEFGTKQRSAHCPFVGSILEGIVDDYDRQAFREDDEAQIQRRLARRATSTSPCPPASLVLPFASLRSASRPRPSASPAASRRAATTPVPLPGS